MATKQLVKMASAVSDLVNSSENLLPASSLGRGSQVKGRRPVYGVGLLPGSTSTET